MLSKRPLMFLSLPGIALVLGLMWFRRKKNVHCDTGGKIITAETNDEIEDKSVRKLKHTVSMPMNCAGDKKKSNENKICKSAPIDINPKKNSPVKMSDQNIDMDVLKMKIQVTEDKTLNSIQENDFESISPIDLPDSVERKRFSFSIKKNLVKEQPVVVKATTAAKISPKQSFVENKLNSSVTQDVKNEPKVNSQAEKKNETTILSSTPSRNQISSPPLSVCSIQSADSGKGSSPPHSEGAPASTYEFLLPQKLIGQILGRKGAYVNKIKSKTGANILIKRHPESNKTKICAIEGTQKEIDAALQMIRQKLPEKRYPNLTLQRIYFFPTLEATITPVDSSHLKLHLIEGINNDVTISSLLSGAHLFFHQPLHPSYPSLSILRQRMNQCYSLCESPTLQKVESGVVCAGNIQSDWYRIEIISFDADTQICLVKYLDYGGFNYIPFSELRQIRTDFMTLPFQAIECVLSNVQPTSAEWSIEAAEVLCSLTQNIILQAQIVGYTVDGIPEVHLYARLAPNRFVFINKELVARNLAVWIDDNELMA